MELAQADTAKRQRFHPRVQATLIAKVLAPDSCSFTKVQNMSMAGLFLEGYAPSLRHLRVRIPLPDDREIFVPCEVRRVEASGTAVEFGPLDWDDFLALARYLHPRLP